MIKIFQTFELGELLKKGIICVHKHQKAFMNKFIGARRRLLRVGRRQVIQVRCGFDRPTDRPERGGGNGGGDGGGAQANYWGRTTTATVMGEGEGEGGEEASKKEREWPPLRRPKRRRRVGVIQGICGPSKHDFRTSTTVEDEAGMAHIRAGWLTHIRQCWLIRS